MPIPRGRLASGSPRAGRTATISRKKASASSADAAASSRGAGSLWGSGPRPWASLDGATGADTDKPPHPFARGDSTPRPQHDGAVFVGMAPILTKGSPARDGAKERCICAVPAVPDPLRPHKGGDARAGRTATISRTKTSSSAEALSPGVPRPPAVPIDLSLRSRRGRGCSPFACAPRAGTPRHVPHDDGTVFLEMDAVLKKESPGTWPSDHADPPGRPVSGIPCAGRTATVSRKKASSSADAAESSRGAATRTRLLTPSARGDSTSSPRHDETVFLEMDPVFGEGVPGAWRREGTMHLRGPGLDALRPRKERAPAPAEPRPSQEKEVVVVVVGRGRWGPQGAVPLGIPSFEDPGRHGRRWGRGRRWPRQGRWRGGLRRRRRPTRRGRSPRGAIRWRRGWRGRRCRPGTWCRRPAGASSTGAGA